MTVTKFAPTYSVTVYSNFSTVTVSYPITCKFTVERGLLSDSTRANIQLYNLAPATRNEIFQDVFTFDTAKWKYVYLKAGYGDLDKAPIIFKGRILQAYSYKSSGSTDVITEIQAQALDVFDCQTSHLFKAGTSYMDIHNTIAADMPNVTIGNVGGLSGTIQTDTQIDGSAFEELNKITNGHSFIDNGVLNTIMDNEVIDVPVPVITESNGLLDTPMRRDANLEVRMLFEPSLIAGQLLEISSTVAPNFNGQYKVIGFTHDCMISGSQAGERTTNVTLWIGPMLPGALTALQNGEIDSNFNKVRGTKVETILSDTPADARTTFQYMQKHQGRLPSTMITKQISWKDMLGHNNTDSERLRECSLDICTNCWTVAQRLQSSILDKYYKGRRVHINSGWRSSRNNASVKGATQSRHLYGLAIDFYISGVSLRDIQKKINASGLWDYNLVEASWVHVQLNPGSRKFRPADK